MSDKPKYQISYMFRLGLSVSIISASIVAYEIQLMHFFTIVQWYHFAYMVISIALLGFGASGTLISLYRTQLLKRIDWLLPFFMISSGFLMSLSIRISRLDFLLFDSYLLFVDVSQFWRLFGTYLLFFLPFFMGSMALGLIFVKKVAQIGTFYFADMLGSGFGGALGIILLWQYEPSDLPWIIALMPVLGGLLIVKNKRLLFVSYSMLVLVSGVLQATRSLNIKPSQFKSISYALNLPEATVDYEKNSPYGLIQVVSSPVQRYAPGLSLNYTDPILPTKVIFNNGNWFSAIPDMSHGADIQVLDHTTMALPYHLGKPSKVLLFHSGAGLEVAQALGHKATKVYAIEPNAGVTELLKGPYAEQTDSLFFRPEVSVVNTTPRAFLQKTRQQFDLIQFPLSGAFGGSVGLNALHEEDLLTEEAFVEMWQKLSPEGMMVLSSYIDLPPRIILRHAGLLSGLMENVQIIDPFKHVVAIRSWATLTYLVKKTPLAPKDVEEVISFCDEHSFDTVLLPGKIQDETNNSFDNEVVFDQIKEMFGPDRNLHIANNTYNISIPTDNKPYFFQFLRLKNLKKQWESLGTRAAFLELGYLIVLVTLFQVVLLAFVLIILPLFRLRISKGKKSWIILYFSGLGIGYMFLEIVLIKYFARFLGLPIYAVAAVISVMLISSGLGSLYSSRIGLNKKNMIKIIGLIGICILVYALLLGSLLGQTEGWELWGKVLVTIVCVSVPAFLMGMPFPMGLQLVNSINKHQVPWAWGINGCMSVISTSLATIIAVEYGFIAVLILACGAYLLSLLSLVLWQGKGARS